MKLLSVYRHKDAVNILYGYLRQRIDDPNTNISHVRLPSFDAHQEFFYRGHNGEPPYRAWYFVVNEDDVVVGSIYLTRAREIGVYIDCEYRAHGYGTEAISMLMKKWPGRFIANINPLNQRSIDLFERFGFVHIQNTYSLEQP